MEIGRGRGGLEERGRGREGEMRDTFLRIIFCICFEGDLVPQHFCTKSK